MINILNNTAGVKEERIQEWKVMFQTPFGLAENIGIAINRCKENDLDPNVCILPVCVAITEHSYEVVIR